MLTPYLARLKVRKQKNLLAGSETQEVEEEEVRRHCPDLIIFDRLLQPDIIAPHWHPVGSSCLAYLLT